MTETRDISEILGLLDWYRSMGADAALAAEPVDWLARGPVPPGQGFQWPDRPDMASAGFVPSLELRRVRSLLRPAWHRPRHSSRA